MVGPNRTKTSPTFMLEGGKIGCLGTWGYGDITAPGEFSSNISLAFGIRGSTGVDKSFPSYL